MKFTLYEIKLWFIENKTRSFHFKPNKVNVITGDSITVYYPTKSILQVQ